MSKQSSRQWLGAWALVAGLGLSGCASMSSGAATEAGVEYFFGDLRGTMKVEAQRLFDVSYDVIDGMGLRVEKSEVTEIDGEIVAYTARDKKVHLRIDSLPGNESKLSIRIGSLGDENLSLRIYERIREGL
jgi:hypothetical protein